MSNIVRKLVISEISGVDKPANKHARVLLLKRLDQAKYDVDAGEAMQKGLDDGLFDTMDKADIEALIKVRADEIKKPGERDASAYARAVSEDPIGRIMFHAAKRASGCEPKTAELVQAQEEVAKARRAAAPKPPKPFKEMSVDDNIKMPVSTAGDAEAEHIGPAHARLHALAVDAARAGNRPYASAHAQIYSNAGNRELREQAKKEYLARAMRGVS
jgi:hypothetical protein